MQHNGAVLFNREKFGSSYIVQVRPWFIWQVFIYFDIQHLILINQSTLAFNFSFPWQLYFQMWFIMVSYNNVYDFLQLWCIKYCLLIWYYNTNKFITDKQ